MVNRSVSQLRLRVFVSGSVQGVGFRASTAVRAAELGIRGYARNLADGRVEVLACGSPEAVHELLGWIERGGPPAASVDAVETFAAGADEALAARFETA